MLRVMGSRTFFALMVITIFSKSSGVMWRSRPRLLLLTESCRNICGRVISRGPEVEEVVWSLSDSSASSFENDSKLLERLGISYCPSELLDAREVAMVVELASEMGSQQNVSLFHTLQLRFSSLRPCSSDLEHREKTAVLLVTIPMGLIGTLGLTCPHVEKVLDILGIDFVD